MEQSAKQSNHLLPMIKANSTPNPILKTPLMAVPLKDDAAAPPLLKKLKSDDTFIIDLTTSDEEELDNEIIRPTIQRVMPHIPRNIIRQSAMLPPPRSALVQENTVNTYFGALETTVVNCNEKCIASEIIPLAALSSNGLVRVRIMPFKYGDAPNGHAIFALKVVTFKDNAAETMDIGMINVKVSFLLSEFIGALQILPMIKVTNGMAHYHTLPIILNVQAPFCLGAELGLKMLGHGFRFRNYKLAGLHFIDPHLLASNTQSFESAPRHSASSATPGSAPPRYPAHAQPRPSYSGPAQIGSSLNYTSEQRDETEIMKGQINALYNSLSPPEDLPEYDQDSKLLTGLFKHQKQALYFMLEKERKLHHIPSASTSLKKDDAMTAEAMTLWRREDNGIVTNLITGEPWQKPLGANIKGSAHDGPSLIRGGILADDMGLGKTIEAIALILHTSSLDDETSPPRVTQVVDLTSDDLEEEVPSSAIVSLKRNEKYDGTNSKTPPLQKDSSISESRLAKEAFQNSNNHAASQSQFASSSKSLALYNTTPHNMDPSFALKKKEALISLSSRKLVATRATLIVCPLSTVSNWEDQIASHVQPGALKVYVYHGTQRDSKLLIKYDVVLTTYNLLSIEYNKEIKSIQNNDAKPFESPLHRVQWKRIMLDEAHIIKDASTGQARSACALATERRWCLTGTPIQNRLEDLYSLVKFLQLEPFSSKSVWNKYFSKVRAETQEIGVSRLQTLMKSLTLRRTKDTKIKGVPILQLPKRQDHIVKLKLEEEEKILYDRITSKAKILYQTFCSGDSSNYVQCLELLLRLRQACVHPRLCKNYESQLDDMSQTGETPVLTQKRLAHLFTLLKDSGDDFCCFCSARAAYGGEVEKAVYVTRCGHMICFECQLNCFAKHSKVECPACKTTLLKNEVLPAKNEEEEDEIIITHSAADGVASPSSSKVKMLVCDLTAVRESALAQGTSPIKSIVFSQWTQDPLTQAGFEVARLDGKMNRIQRTAQLERFRINPSCTVMLISIRAGGVGLNLTHASRVYIMEPYWNPAVEQQAIDRVHRMGQTLPVICIRFIIADSVEERMIDIQNRKRKLASMTFNEDCNLLAKTRKGKQEMKMERLANMKMLLFGNDHHHNTDLDDIITIK